MSSINVMKHLCCMVLALTLFVVSRISHLNLLLILVVLFIAAAIYFRDECIHENTRLVEGGGTANKIPISLGGWLFLFFLGFALAAGVSQKDSASTTLDEKYDAAMKCQELELAVLNDPSSAEFDDYRNYYVTDTRPGYHGFVVTGRGRNSFNGWTQFRFECVVQKAGDKWQVIRFDQWN